MTKLDLKVKKVNRLEVDSKADTYTVNLQGTTARGVNFSLTVSAYDLDELERVIPTVTGDIIEMELKKAQYGDLESYDKAVRLAMQPVELSRTELSKVLEDLEDTGFSAENVQAAIDQAEEQTAQEITAGFGAVEAIQEAQGSQDSQPEALEARRRAWTAQEAPR